MLQQIIGMIVAMMAALTQMLGGLLQSLFGGDEQADNPTTTPPPASEAPGNDNPDGNGEGNPLGDLAQQLTGILGQLTQILGDVLGRLFGNDENPGNGNCQHNSEANTQTPPEIV